jgi:hypothetical protein
MILSPFRRLIYATFKTDTTSLSSAEKGSTPSSWLDQALTFNTKGARDVREDSPFREATREVTSCSINAFGDGDGRRFAYPSGALYASSKKVLTHGKFDIDRLA